MNIGGGGETFGFTDVTSNEGVVWAESVPVTARTARRIAAERTPEVYPLAPSLGSASIIVTNPPSPKSVCGHPTVLRAEELLSD